MALTGSPPLPSILIVDDEVEIRSMIKEYIEGIVTNARIYQASNGAEGIAMAMNQKFDLVVTDLKMPRMDGKMFHAALQELGPAYIPKACFIMSGHMSEDAVAREIGKVTFFPKPIDTARFAQCVRKQFGLVAPGVTASSKPKVDINFINPFVEATLNVLSVTAGIEASREELFIRGADQISGDVSAIIALNSDTFMGSFAVSFQEPCILAVVSNMVGVKYSAIDADVESGAAEICNQIFGSAKKVLNQSGHTVQQALPSVVCGKGHKISHGVDGICIAVKFSTLVGRFQVEAILKNK